MSRVPVLGVGVDPLPFAAILDAVGEAVVTQRPITVAYANVYVLNAAATDPALRAFLNVAEIVLCDGNGVRVGARLLGRVLPHRMTGADWIWDLAERAEGAWRIYWLGGRPGRAEAAAQALLARHPRLAIATDHGYHARTGPEDDACLARINAFQPDVVLVGLGTPAQERWVAARRARIQAPVVWCVGATADFLSGAVRRGPRWLTDRAEWLDRLWTDPARLWRRYLLGNFVFLARIARERLRGAPPG